MDQFAYISRVLVKRLFHQPPRPYHILQVLQNLHNLARSERRRAQCQGEYHVPIPSICILSVTYRCNLECNYCYAKVHPAGEQLTLGEIGFIIGNVLNYGTSIIVITGGEPLLLKNLVPGLGKFRQGLFLLFTNGLLIGDETIRRFRQCPNILPVISYEGTDDFTDRRRGSGTTAIIRTAMESLRSNHILFGLSVTATHKNIREIISDGFIKQLTAMGASCLFIIDYFAAPEYDDETLWLTEEDMALKRMALSKFKKKAPLVIMNMPEDESLEGTCAGGGKGLIHISASGHAGVCPFLGQSTENVFEKDYIDILKSEIMSDARKSASGQPNRPCHCMVEVPSGCFQSCL